MTRNGPTGNGRQRVSLLGRLGMAMKKVPHTFNSPDRKTVTEVIMFELQEDDIGVTALPDEHYAKGEDRGDE
jgi:hypothetical protein